MFTLFGESPPIFATIIHVAKTIIAIPNPINSQGFFGRGLENGVASGKVSTSFVSSKSNKSKLSSLSMILPLCGFTFIGYYITKK